MNSTGGRIIIGQRYAEILHSPLERFFSRIIEMPDNPHVDARLSGQVDLAMLKTGTSQVIIPINLKDSATEALLHESGIKTVYTEDRQGRIYPEDSGLNVCVCGDYLIYNPATADKRIEAIFPEKKRIEVKQGYTGCSVCKAGPESIITSDRGIHREAEKVGLNSLLISPGHIDLDGFDYGFIGGSSFMVNGVLMFTGSIEAHPSYNDIRSFLNNLSVDYETLTDRRVFDIGGALTFN